MIGWVIGLFLGLAIAAAGIICVTELVVLRHDPNDPLTGRDGLVPEQTSEQTK